MQNQNGQNVKGDYVFVRRGGRVIKFLRHEKRVARDIAQNSGHAGAKVLGAGASSLGVLYGAGALSRYAGKVGNKKLNFAAKILKFAGVSMTGLVAGSSIASIDRRVNDEKSRFFNIGEQATSPLGIGAQLAVAYGFYRFGKRFEFAGKKGINILKKSNWYKLKNVKDL